MEPIIKPPILFSPPPLTATAPQTGAPEETTQALDTVGQAAKIQTLIKNHFDISHSSPPFPAPLHN